MIEKFSDLPGLVSAWVSSESLDIDDDTGFCIGWGAYDASAQPGEIALNAERGDRITQDEFIGVLPALTIGESEPDRLEAFFNPTINLESTGLTYALLVQVDALPPLYRDFFNLAQTGGTSSRFGCNADGFYLRGWYNNISYTSPVSAGDSAIYVITVGTGQNTCNIYRDGVADAGNPWNSELVGRADAVDHISVCNRISGSNSVAGAVSVCAVYAEELDSAQALELHDLIAHWRDYGEPPVVGTPPSITQDPEPNVSSYAGGSIALTASANGDPFPDLQWQAVLKSDPDTQNYQPCSAVFAGTVTGETTENLSIDLLGEDESAFIRLFASNVAGNAVSSASDLSILLAPPEKSGTFGPVSSTDPNAELIWERETGGQWHDHDDPTNGLSNSVAETSSGGQTGDTLNIQSVAFADAGGIRCRAVTSYDEKITTAQLVVVEDNG